jgi:hypothetical protein
VAYEIGLMGWKYVSVAEVQNIFKCFIGIYGLISLPFVMKPGLLIMALPS